LIEVALATDFELIHFEPMILYPTGGDIVWDPLFTWIATVVATIAGATTRSEIIDVMDGFPPRWVLQWLRLCNGSVQKLATGGFDLFLPYSLPQSRVSICQDLSMVIWIITSLKLCFRRFSVLCT
jgi:hypothetical protein